MKKSWIISLVLIISLFLLGCLDYKAYDIPKENVTTEDAKNDANLIKEIEKIEKDIKQKDSKTAVNTSVKEQNKTTQLKNESQKNETKKTTKSEQLKKEEAQPVSTPKAEPRSLDDTSTFMVIKVKENEVVKLKLNISDPDRDPVSYTFSKPLDKNGEWKTSYGDAGEYVTTITASDGKLTSAKKIRIIVERVNVAPVIEGVKNMTVNEGEIVKFEPKVKDPNNDPITVKISKPLDTGVFNTGFNSAGEYSVTVTASDGETETKVTFKLLINNVNQLPVISDIQDMTVKEGEVVKIKPTVTDLDNDKLTISISDPVGDDGLWETKFTDHGKYGVIITASDGRANVTKKVNLLIEDVNMAPEIVSVELAKN